MTPPRAPDQSRRPQPPALSRRAVLGGALALGAGGGAWAATRLIVFAAASLRNALDEIAAAFRDETGVTAAISYAGSSRLARQIMAGAPAALFVSANPAWMDRVEAAGLLAADSRADLTGNRLVLIAPGADQSPITLGPESDLAGRLGDGRLAMALVDAVPAGIYGKAALSSLGLWDGLAPRIAQADNVRAALALVARGEAPLGIVYASDAAAEPRVSVLATFPEESHPPIRYPAAILAEHDGPAARALHRRLFASADVFARWGFSPAPV